MKKTELFCCDLARGQLHFEEETKKRRSPRVGICTECKERACNWTAYSVKINEWAIRGPVKNTERVVSIRFIYHNGRWERMVNVVVIDEKNSECDSSSWSF